MKRSGLCPREMFQERFYSPSPNFFPADSGGRGYFLLSFSFLSFFSSFFAFASSFSFPFSFCLLLYSPSISSSFISFYSSSSASSHTCFSSFFFSFFFFSFFNLIIVFFFFFVFFSLFSSSSFSFFFSSSSSSSSSSSFLLRFLFLFPPFLLLPYLSLFSLESNIFFKRGPKRQELSEGKGVAGKGKGCVILEAAKGVGI